MRGPLSSSAQYIIPGEWKGLVKMGNIDLNARPIVQNPDGSFSTVKSVSFNVDGHEVLMPQVVNGRVVSPQAALHNYLKTGQHLGVFRTPAAANAYATALHVQQAKAYSAAASGLNSAKGALASYGH